MTIAPDFPSGICADPFVVDAQDGAAAQDFASLQQRPVAAFDASQPAHQPGAVAMSQVPTLGRLIGFDLLDQPIVGQLVALPGRTIASRSVVSLSAAQIGREVLVCFADGDLRSPVIVGVVESHPLTEPLRPAMGVAVVADGQRHVIEAEREIVLRCGEASITLTRAGKVLIKGHYILSRSTGYNKIKGAAIDIN